MPEIALPRLRRYVETERARRLITLTGGVVVQYAFDADNRSAEQPISPPSIEELTRAQAEYDLLDRSKALKSVFEEAGRLISLIRPAVALTMTDLSQLEARQAVDMMLSWVSRVSTDPLPATWNDSRADATRMILEWRSLTAEALRIEGQIRGLIIRGNTSVVIRRLTTRSIEQALEVAVETPITRTTPFSEGMLVLPYLTNRQILKSWNIKGL